MANKVEQEIIGIFSSDISQLLSINAIARILGKAYPNINKNCNSMVKDGILKKVIVGRSHLCSLNLSSDRSIALLTLGELTKQQKKKLEAFQILAKKISQEFKIVTVYHDSQTLVFVLDHLFDKHAILSEFKELRKNNPDFIDENGLRQRIANDYGFFSKVIVLYSYESFYRISASVMRLRIGDMVGGFHE